MENLIFWFRRWFICETIFSNGHSPVKEVRETSASITQFKCKRCNCTLGLGYIKGLRYIYPPNSTPEQKKKYDNYMDKKETRLRNGITDDI